MEHINSIAQEKTVGNLSDDELQQISLDPETFKTIEAVIKENPKFKDMTFMQLKSNEEFQQALKDYRAKYPLADNLQNEIPKIITALNSTKVDDYLIANTKVANLLPSGKLTHDKPIYVVVNGQTSRTKEVTTKVVLSYDNDNPKFIK